MVGEDASAGAATGGHVGLSRLGIALGTPRANGVAIIMADLEPKESARSSSTPLSALVRDYFWPSRAALRQIGLSEHHANMRRVLRWIGAQRSSEVSREEVRRDALGRASTPTGDSKLLDRPGEGRLAARRPRRRPQDAPGRRWRVNPKLSLTVSVAESAESAESQ